MTSAADLIKDLADSRDRDNWMVWTELPLGSIGQHDGRVPKADVLAASKSFAALFIIYEVKVSRGDFLADMNKGKYRNYFPYCSRLYFAAPSGIIRIDEVPEGCGLTVRSDTGRWHVVKAAPRREFKPTEELLLKLLMRGHEDRLVRWRQAERLRLLEYKGLKEAGRRFGVQVARDIANSQEFLASAEALKKRVEEATGKTYRDIADALYALQTETARLLGHRVYTPHVVEMVNLAFRLMEGTYWAENVPEQLRHIAQAIEATRMRERSDAKERVA